MIAATVEWAPRVMIVLGLGSVGFGIAYGIHQALREPRSRRPARHRRQGTRR